LNTFKTQGHATKPVRSKNFLPNGPPPGPLGQHLDLSREILAVRAQRLGDTVLTTG